MRRFRAAVAAAATTTLVAGGALAAVAIGSSTAAAATSALSSNWYASAPYDMPMDNTPPDLTQVLAATGEKAYVLAFVLAENGSACAPAWDGGSSAVSSSDAVASQINALRAVGGDVAVSFGGYNGTKLGQVCGSASATAAAEQQVINAYGLHAIDLDLEEPEYENTGAIANELGAAQILQQNNPGIYISVTIPGTTSGTGWFGEQLLDEAKTLGFTPNSFTIMPFDGGFSGGSSQISALEAFNSILTSTFGWSSATAYAHEGVLLDERAHRLGRVLLPGRLPVGAQLGGERRARPLLVLGGQPRPRVQPAGQQRHPVRHLLQRDPEQLGLHQVRRPVRRRHPAGEPAADHLEPLVVTHLDQRRRWRHRKLRRGMGLVPVVLDRRRGVVQRARLDREPVERRRGSRRLVRRLDRRRSLLSSIAALG